MSNHPGPPGLPAHDLFQYQEEYYWRVFTSYIKRKAAGLNLKVEMAAAVLITTGIVAGTLLQAPPFTGIMTLNDKIKAYWEQQAPSGPAPHAEEFSLVRLAGDVGLSVDDVTTALRQEGFAVEDPEISIGELAKQNGIAPSDVYLAVFIRWSTLTTARNTTSLSISTA